MLFNVTWESNAGKILEWREVTRGRVHELKEQFDVQREFIGARNFTVYILGITETMTFTKFTATYKGNTKSH
jgi:hypothetical protein